MKRAGFLGPNGTFSHLALDEFITEYPVEECLPFTDFIELYAAFENGKVDLIIVPVENMIEGQVNEPLDRLLTLKKGTITNELVLPIHHDLMGLPGAKKETITTVVSHPQALKQCATYLQENLSHPHQLNANSTAQAALHLSQKIYGEDVAIIGNRLLASLYNLETIDKNIQDRSHNKTRFWIISNDKTQPTATDRTSFVFGTQKDEPGSLVRILNVFADAGINLTKILSRPTKSSLGEYLFFIDCEGHIDDNTLKPVFKAVKESAAYFKWLGSYTRRKFT